MSDDRAAFLRAIADQSADRTARLAFADFLEETGDAADAVRAEFVRAQVEAETVHPNSNRAAELDARARELFSRHWLDWWRSVCTAVGLPEPYRPMSGVRGWFARRFTAPPPNPGHPYSRGWGFNIDVAGQTAPPDTLRRIRFAGGFPDTLTFLGQLTPVAELLHRWPEAAPLARLELNGVVGRDWRAIDGPHMSGLRALELKFASSTVVDPVTRSRHLTQLEELRIAPDRANLAWGEQAYRALALSPLVARVRRLSVEVGTPAEVWELWGAPFQNLAVLDVRAPRAEWVNVSAVVNGVAELVPRIQPGEVEELTLDATTSGAIWAPAWSRAPRLRRLELVLRNPPPDRADPFPPERLFPALTDLTVSVWYPGWIEALAVWPVTGRLRHLRLDGRLPRSDDSVAALTRLAQALDAGSVETVRVGLGVCGATVRAALAQRFGDRVRFG